MRIPSLTLAQTCSHTGKYLTLVNALYVYVCVCLWWESTVKAKILGLRCQKLCKSYHINTHQQLNNVRVIVESLLWPENSLLSFPFFLVLICFFFISQSTPSSLPNYLPWLSSLFCRLLPLPHWGHCGSDLSRGLISGFLRTPGGSGKADSDNISVQDIEPWQCLIRIW